MITSRKFAIVVAASAALGVVAFAASPATAQGWYYNDGYGPGWRSPDPRGDSGPYRGYDYGPGYGYYGYPGVDAGITDFAICPGGYHLGRSGRLCWPD